jgi:hypothetical protein
MNPHFYRLRKETVRKSPAGRATERCERDFLRIVPGVSNSNKTRQPTDRNVPSNRLKDSPDGALTRDASVV